jgi:hypothetical protein
MKIKLLEINLNTTLSCKFKCLKFFKMIYKKITLGLFSLIFLGACTTPTAMLGPAYTLTSSGNVLQAGFSYGSSELVILVKHQWKMQLKLLQVKIIFKRILLKVMISSI